MKKKFLALLSLVLVAIFMMLSGCSGATILTFENKFYGTSAVPVGYTETATYKVESGEYDTLIRDSSISEQTLTYDISGTLTTKLLVYDANLISTKFNDEGIETDITYADKGRVYYYETVLQVDANYTINGEQIQSPSETITTKIYFLDIAQSLSPIWSQTVGNYSYLVGSTESGFQVNKVETKYTTIYNKNKYSIAQEYKIYKFNQSSDVTPIQKSHNKNYTAKTILDNNQLLFAIRNFKPVEKDASAYLPTLSPVYGQTTTLAVKNIGTKTETLKNFNGNVAQLDVPVTEYEFYASSNKNTGVQKYVLVQNGVATNLPAKAHIVKYVEPLTILGGTFPCIGALIYTLNSVDIVNP